jgi:hypothetical protein
MVIRIQDSTCLPKGSSSEPDTVDRLQKLLKEQLSIQSDWVFQVIWKQSLSSHQIQIGKGPLPVDEIISAVRETVLYHGPGIDWKGTENPQNGQRLVDEIVKYLFGRGSPSFDWVNAETVKGVFLRKDPVLLKKMEESLRSALLTDLPQDSKEETVFKAFIGNVIALLPFCYPEEGREFVIPQKVDGIWKRASYTIDKKFELTPRWLGSPIVAYGMTSTDAPPVMTFLGTTYPAGDGFFATLFADFTPGFSIGHAPYLVSQEKIAEWLKEKTDVRLFGMSLGGAIAFHVMRNHEKEIGHVAAFNPPGLYPWNWSGSVQTEIDIYYQYNDLVGTTGVFPEGKKVNIFRVIGEREENSYKAHARIYSGGKEVTVLKSSPQFENSRGVRKLLTFLHFFLGALFVFCAIFSLYLLTRSIQILISKKI